MVWEGEGTAPNLFQPPKEKAKQSPTSVPKETLIKERYSAVSGVPAVFICISRVFAQCIQGYQCVQAG